MGDVRVVVSLPVVVVVVPATEVRFAAAVDGNELGLCDTIAEKCWLRANYE